MQLSAQETFDRTLAMMRAQGKPAMGETACKYRLKLGDEILKCAAGHWIPDELYRDMMECNGSLPGNAEVRILLNNLPDRPDYPTLVVLQRVHDATALKDPNPLNWSGLFGTKGVVESIQPADSWLVNMERAAAIVAKNLGLNYSAPAQ